MASDFIPPISHTPVLSFLKLILPIALSQQHMEVRASRNCINTVRSLAGKQTVILVNHCDRSDPVAVFALSKLCGEDFYYLAARELFDREFGSRGFFMQHSGCYSVIRGEPKDELSKRATIEIVARGDRKLIMFPEGDVTGRDDAILPLKEDGIRNIFEAQSQLQNDGGESVYLLPLSIYYEVKPDALMPLDKAIFKLESALNLSWQRLDLEDRVVRILSCFIDHLEERYGIQSSSNAPHLRLLELCKRASEAIARANGVHIGASGSEARYLYSVKGQLRRLKNRGPIFGSRFGETLKDEIVERAASSRRDLKRLQELLILANTVQQRPFTVDLAWRIVDRLESLVFGKASAKGTRVAWFESAQPIRLLDLWQEYQIDNQKGLEHAIWLVRTSIYESLQMSKNPPNREKTSVAA